MYARTILIVGIISALPASFGHADDQTEAASASIVAPAPASNNGGEESSKNAADPSAARWPSIPGENQANPATAATDQQSPAVRMLLDNQARHISFQALLTNEQGNPIPMPNGEHELDFRLYDVEQGGAPIGEILDVLLTLDGGVASTQVGPMDPAWFDGTARWLGVSVDNGDELQPRIALGSVPYAFRVDRVASQELDDDIQLGDSSTSGSMAVYSGAPGTESITLDGAAGRLRVGNPLGQGGTTLHGQGQLIATRDDNGVLVALYGYDALGGGAACLLGTAGGAPGLVLEGDAPGNTGGAVVLFNSGAAESISLSAGDATIRAGSVSGGVAGQMHLYPAAGGPSRIHLDGEQGDLRLGLTGNSSGDLTLWSSSGGAESIQLEGGTGTARLGSAQGGVAGNLHLYPSTAGPSRIHLDGQNADLRLGLTGDSSGDLTLWSSSGGAESIQLEGGTGTVRLGSVQGGVAGNLHLYPSTAGPSRIHLDGQSADLRLGLTGDSSGNLRLWSSGGGVETIHLNGGAGIVSITDAANETVRIDGDENGGGGVITMSNSAVTQTVEIDADEGDNAIIRLGAAGSRDTPGASGTVVMYPGGNDASPTVQLRGNSGEIVAGWASQTSGSLWLYSSTDTFGSGPRIQLNGQTGWTNTQVLNITGGSDLSERFDIQSRDEPVAPGTVVCIDPDRPGKLTVCERSYDRTIAGIVSGANGVRPGMLMGQTGSEADGQYPVALTGRVYVRADTSGASIEPGDLLTSSGKPGFAMKVSDFSHAHGAILGKAMTALPKGENGFVLVLVSLQ